MTADSPSSADARRSPRARLRWLPWIVGCVGGLALLTALLVIGFDARLDASTIGLVLAAAGLVFCLHTLYRVVQALSRPSLALAVEREDELGLAGRRELQEERRRLLRAIRELEFDHQMGKLSDSDYEEVRAGYELRAIEVMRALQDEPSLEPDLLDELEARGISVRRSPSASSTGAQTPVVAQPEVPPAASTGGEEKAAARVEPRACSTCGGENDMGAKFCKHCGKEIAA